MLCSTLPGVVIGELGIDQCLLWEGDPASCMYAMPTESGVWERSPGGMRIELSPKSTHGCPNTISSSLSFSPSHQAPSFLEKLGCLRQKSVLATPSSFGCLPSFKPRVQSFSAEASFTVI